ncbi:MAG: hypothetical protein KJ621_09585 [Proteobacteria bacterium]|nr:hypothetical protein [Pseudomonadota bacterium]MBU1740655.1 hypothetical protein [Pseudomonadota bacterium]
MATYDQIKAMWADLGMDLPAHDAYVNAFPARFKEIIDRQGLHRLDHEVKRIAALCPAS